MTRKINKNTGSQVNGRTIGVLVHPDYHPAVYRVDEIVLDFAYQTVTVSPYLPDHSVTALETATGAVYYYGQVSMIVDDVDYYKFEKYDGEEGDPDELWSDVDDQTVEEGSTLYVYDGVSMVSFTTVNSIFSANTDFMVTETQYGPCFALGYPDAMIEGSYMLDYLGKKIGYISGENFVTDTDVHFEKSTYAVNQDWENDSYIDTYDTIIRLRTTEIDPAVGSKAYWIIGEDYGEQTIKSLVTTDEPAYYDAVNCVVSYSVDGSTFTELSDEAMTDDNNVITNIPKYLYLSFSQDVEITEE